MTETNTEEGNARLRAEQGHMNRLSGTLPDLKAHLIFWSIATAGLLLDIWTKNAVFDWLGQQPSQNVSIINGFLRFIIAYNDGAAFSFLAGKSNFLMVFSVVALIAVLSLFLFSGKQHRLIHTALGLFTGGICGNLYDRIFNEGSVRDFIDVYIGNMHWPTFNVADILLCIGVGVTTISIILTERSSQKRAQPHK